MQPKHDCLLTEAEKYVQILKNHFKLILGKISHSEFTELVERSLEELREMEDGENMSVSVDELRKIVKRRINLYLEKRKERGDSRLFGGIERGHGDHENGWDGIIKEVEEENETSARIRQKLENRSTFKSRGSNFGMEKHETPRKAPKGSKLPKMDENCVNTSNVPNLDFGQIEPENAGNGLSEGAGRPRMKSRYQEMLNRPIGTVFSGGFGGLKSRTPRVISGYYARGNVGSRDSSAKRRPGMANRSYLGGRSGSRRKKQKKVKTEASRRRRASKSDRKRLIQYLDYQETGESTLNSKNGRKMKKPKNRKKSRSRKKNNKRTPQRAQNNPEDEYYQLTRQRTARNAPKSVKTYYYKFNSKSAAKRSPSPRSPSQAHRMAQLARMDHLEPPNSYNYSSSKQSEGSSRILRMFVREAKRERQGTDDFDKADLNRSMSQSSIRILEKKRELSQSPGKLLELNSSNGTRGRAGGNRSDSSSPLNSFEGRSRATSRALIYENEDRSIRSKDRELREILRSSQKRSQRESSSSRVRGLD